MGESITEGTVVALLKSVGDQVHEDEVVVQLETDKVTVDVRSPVSGVIREMLAAEGDNVSVGKGLFRVEVGASASPDTRAGRSSEQPEQRVPEADHIEPREETSAKMVSPPAPPSDVEHGEEHAEAAASQLLGRSVVQRGPAAAAAGSVLLDQDEAGERRVPMSRMRRRIAERLKHAQNTAAMLTTFNECDLSSLAEMRASFKDGFEKRYGSKLGYMSAFVKAVAIALDEQPEVNAVIDGDEIVYREYIDISVAVSTPTGLMTPVLRGVEKMSFADIELQLADFAKRARDGQIRLEELQGGTFTISNGGVFGSLLSTPIINMPQSAILGMHAIQRRPVVVGEEIAIRPMMYLALTYDHRLIDGREAVTFLRRIKALIEDPRRMLVGVYGF
jgi:2-oxoglutarate dehydrogenase E2 component (dihydrolipoamide succinyltransferase)